MLGISKRFKKHWVLSLVLLIVAIALLVFATYRLEMTDVSVALIAITTPTVYYFYTDFLSRPTISVQPIERPYQVRTDMVKLRHGDGGPWLSCARPVIFYHISVKNSGKNTAKNATAEVRIVSDETEKEFYGRWDTPTTPEQRDLLPGEDQMITAMKFYLLEELFTDAHGARQAEDMGNFGDPERGYSFADGVAQFPRQPDGEVLSTSEVVNVDVGNRTYIPRRKREGIEGGSTWEGIEIPPDEYDLSIRILSDNYKSPWMNVTSIQTPEDFLNSAEDPENWSDQWDISEELKGVKRGSLHLVS